MVSLTTEGNSVFSPLCSYDNSVMSDHTGHWNTSQYDIISLQNSYLRTHQITRTNFFLNDTFAYLSDSSPTDRCAAKHAIAHMRIWMPWYNCLPRMSHTPWFGTTWALVCTVTPVHVPSNAHNTIQTSYIFCDKNLGNRYTGFAVFMSNYLLGQYTVSQKRAHL